MNYFPGTEYPPQRTASLVGNSDVTSGEINVDTNYFSQSATFRKQRAFCHVSGIAQVASRDLAAI